MTATILGIVASVVALVVWLVKRKIEADDAKTPADKLHERVGEVDREIVNSDGPAASARLDEWLRRIPKAGSGSASGQNGDVPKGGASGDK